MKSSLRFLSIVLIGLLAVAISSCDNQMTSPMDSIVDMVTDSPTESVTPPDQPMLPEGMELIPAGEFRMGSNHEEADSDERPVHSVYVDAFYMDKYEVTNAEYQEFVPANPEWQKNRINARFHNRNYLKFWNGNDYPDGKSNHPVTYVSWYAAMVYAEWRGKRLPTEAEWEKAARGGLADLTYPWGNTIDSNNANYNSNIGDTTPVGQYSPNAYGLYDLAGNVWEWCLDEYNAGFYAISPSQNPISGADNVEWVLDNYTDIESSRILRGGAYPAQAHGPGGSPSRQPFAYAYELPLRFSLCEGCNSLNFYLFTFYLFTQSHSVLQ